MDTQRVIAGGIVFFSLVLLADIEPLATLAVAFALLILIATAMTVGPVAFGRVSELVGGTNTGGGGGGKKRS